jgi:hypothetical protein
MTCSRCHHQAYYVRDYIEGKTHVWVYYCEFCHSHIYVRRLER